MIEDMQTNATILEKPVVVQKQSKTGLWMILMMILGFALVYVITHFLAQVDEVVGQSMEPTLHQGQYLFVDRMVYRFHEPQFGDIVAIQWGANGVVKRVIGLPGDQIKIENGHVYRNGKQLEEPYIKEPAKDKYGPLTVPKGTVFLLGDNRNESRDSRSFGPVPFGNIIGRADAVIYPFSQFHAQPFGTAPHE
jgi:signal peptidase I